MPDYLQHVNLIQANVEALTQGKGLLKQLTQEQFVCVCEPYVFSTIGEHIRHVLDMYRSLMVLDSNTLGNEVLIDYDSRTRGNPVEKSREAALVAVEDVLAWVMRLEQFHSQEKWDFRLSIKTEVCLESTATATIASNLARELVFVSSHAVHHFALIAVIAKLQDVDVPQSFGVAPATATFLRGEVACAP